MVYAHKRRTLLATWCSAPVGLSSPLVETKRIVSIIWIAFGCCRQERGGVYTEKPRAHLIIFIIHTKYVRSSVKYNHRKKLSRHNMLNDFIIFFMTPKILCLFVLECTRSGGIPYCDFFLLMGSKGPSSIRSLPKRPAFIWMECAWPAISTAPFILRAFVVREQTNRFRFGRKHKYIYMVSPVAESERAPDGNSTRSKQCKCRAVLLLPIRSCLSRVSVLTVHFGCHRQYIHENRENAYAYEDTSIDIIEDRTLRGISASTHQYQPPPLAEKHNRTTNAKVVECYCTLCGRAHKGGYIAKKPGEMRFGMCSKQICMAIWLWCDAYL